MGHPKPDTAVDAATTFRVVLVIGVQDVEFVAKELSHFITCVSDKRLVLAEFEPQLLSQEASDVPLDSLSLHLRADKPQQEVIGVPDVPQAPEVRVSGVPRGKVLGLLREPSRLLPVTPLPGA